MLMRKLLIYGVLGRSVLGLLIQYSLNSGIMTPGNKSFSQMGMSVFTALHSAQAVPADTAADIF